jgi:hypothetical protein
VSSWKAPERRKSLVEIIANLGFQDRREADGQPVIETSVETSGEQVASQAASSANAAPAEEAVRGVSAEYEGVVAASGDQKRVQQFVVPCVREGDASQRRVSLTVVPAEEAVPGVSAQLSVSAPAEYEGVTEMFRDAQRYAAEQRMAAERALEEARAFESRIAEETERLAAASALFAKVQPLVEAAERAAAHELAVLDGVQVTEAKCARLAEERKHAESAHDALRADEKAANAEVTRLEELLAKARGDRAVVDAAVASAVTEVQRASQREDAARREAVTKDQALVEARQTLEEAKAAIAALDEHGLTTSGKASPRHFEEQLRTLGAQMVGANAPATTVTAIVPALALRPEPNELEERIAERHEAVAL